MTISATLAGMDDHSNYGNVPGDGPLRPGGQSSASVGPEADENLPSTFSEAAKAQQETLELVRDIAGGTKTVRAAAARYLPKAPGEQPANYNLRLNRSVFFNVFGHTIEGLVGQVFRRDPALQDDVPTIIRGDEDKGIVGHWENIDNAGTHGDVFVRERLQDGLEAGHCGILVEFPKTGGTQDATSENPNAVAAPIRPYWVEIKKDNIVSWRTVVVDGRTILAQLVLQECQRVPDGAFGEKELTRYRVFRRSDAGEVSFELLRITDDKRILVDDSGTYPTQNEIPFAEIKTSGRTALLESEPPLLDLAYLNIAHYQTWSDYATSLHKTCVPVYVETGVETQTDTAQAVVIGPNSARRFSNENAKAYYVSHTGAALNEVKQALDDLKSDMGTLGLAMLSPQKRTAETAAAKRLDKATEDSALAVTARGLQDGIERALYFHARYLQDQPEGGSIKVNKEFDAQSMQADMLTAWTNAVATAKIPPRLMVDAMQVGELIDQDEDVDAIALEMEANVAAEAEQKANALQDQITNATGGRKPVVKPAEQAA